MAVEGFAGLSCAVHLTDGRTLYSPDSQEEIEERAERAGGAKLFPIIPVRDSDGRRRFIAPAHIVEFRPLDHED